VGAYTQETAFSAINCVKKTKGEDGKCIGSTCVEETWIKTVNDTKNPEESSDKELHDKDILLLVCNLWVEIESFDDFHVITQADEILHQSLEIIVDIVQC